MVAVVLLITAGCAGQDSQSTSPTAETTTAETEVGIATETTTETEGEITDETTTESEVEIPVEGAPFPVDSGTVFRRIEGLLDKDLSVPTIRVLKVQPDGEPGTASTDAFSRRMGIDRQRSLNEVGGNAHNGVVRILYTENGTAEKMEQVLAHEFVHVGQPERLWQRLTAKQGSYNETTDAEITRKAVREGVAAYVTNRYTEQYLPGTTHQGAYPEWETLSAGTKWRFAPYRFGAEYVDGRIDDPSAVTSIYDDPPVTSEQLLHGYAPDAEPPRNLSVDPKTENASWQVENTDTKGELFVRTILAEQLDESRAATAAAGWGNDRVVTLGTDNRTLHAWTVRWDDEHNATEFETATEAYLDGRAAEKNGVWIDGDSRTDGELQFDIRRVDATTVVLLVDEHEVGNVSVTGSEESVAIQPNATQ